MCEFTTLTFQNHSSTVLETFVFFVMTALEDSAEFVF